MALDLTRKATRWGRVQDMPYRALLTGQVAAAMSGLGSAWLEAPLPALRGGRRGPFPSGFPADGQQRLLGGCGCWRGLCSSAQEETTTENFYKQSPIACCR